jgi:hypothetical protein
MQPYLLLCPTVHYNNPITSQPLFIMFRIASVFALTLIASGVFLSLKNQKKTSTDHLGI